MRKKIEAKRMEINVIQDITTYDKMGLQTTRDEKVDDTFDDMSPDNLINKDKIVDNEKVNINYLLQT